ncbi:MAG: hypothetical protein ACK56I_10500, partial [bacterium]
MDLHRREGRCLELDEHPNRRLVERTVRLGRDLGSSGELNRHEPTQAHVGDLLGRARPEGDTHPRASAIRRFGGRWRRVRRRGLVRRIRSPLRARCAGRRAE